MAIKLSREDVQSEYDDSASAEAEHDKVKWASEDKMMLRFQHAMKVISFAEVERWLDVGAGTGAFQRLVLQQFPVRSVVGIDLSQRLLDYAKERALENSLDCRYVLSDFLEFQDAGFDLLTCIGVLQRSNMSLEEFTRHASRLLLPSGKLYLDMKHLGWKDFVNKVCIPEPTLR